MNNNPKIFVVEDELIAAESLAIDLKKLGYKVAGIANSREKAIQKISHTHPELVLMDIKLKGKDDGITTAEEIRNKFEIPVIYLTAYADPKTLERAKNTSPYGYLVKPYKIQDLGATIEVAIQKHKHEQQVRENLAQEKEINTLKSRALALAAHDLRNPLTNILGYTELLKEYSDQFSLEKKNQYFEYIKSAVTVMNESLEDLLIISKAEEGKLAFEPEYLDVVLFCRNLVEEFIAILTEEYSLNFICQSQSYQANLDPKIIRHILTNLLSNAIKYSPQGGKIIVELICGRGQIVFQIQDQGIGIPLEYQAKIFQLFERADNVGSIKGTGLGLCIIKKCVDLHGGTIQIESKENVGTTFTITILTDNNFN